MVNRVIWIVLDSVGIGSLPDAALFGDEGCNTLTHVVEHTGISLPNMARLGLGAIESVSGVSIPKDIIGVYGRCGETANGKDTTIGHWEMAGYSRPSAFPVYPNGFPSEIIMKFEESTGRRVVGNVPMSGTVILEELGPHQMETGDWIVYTSADSVFQIAAHEDIIPLEELYDACRTARALLSGEHEVARVIARPYIGKAGDFSRTANRRDFSVSPEETILDIMKDNGFDVIAVGKIEDIFNGKGITEAVHTKDNKQGVDLTVDYILKSNKGIIYTNLVDFDAKWGHRNNVEAYGQGLVEFDKRIPEIIDAMRDDDVLIITADHGCDPTTPGTDHTREYIPFLAYGKTLKQGVSIGTRPSFADIAQTIAQMFGVKATSSGEGFYDLINNRR